METLVMFMFWVMFVAAVLEIIAFFKYMPRLNLFNPELLKR